MGVRPELSRRFLAAVVLVALAGCGSESSGTPKGSTRFAATPTAAPSPTQSYACGEGPPRHARLIAVSATGGERWKLDLPDPVDSDGQVRPVLSDSTTYVMSSGTVLAVAAGNGKVRWSTDVGTTGYGLWLDGNTLVASTDQVGPDAQINGLDVASGHILWTYRPGGSGLLGDQLPTSDGRLAMVDSAGRTVVLDMTSGAVRWRSPGRVQAYGLGVAEDVVLRGIGGVLTAYDTDGKELWHRTSVDPAGLNTLGTLGVVTGAAVGPSIDGSASAYDARTGKPLWKVRTESAMGWGGGGPSGIALFAEDGGRPFFIAVDPGTGKQLWRAVTQIGLFLPAFVGRDALTTVEGGTSIQKDVKLVRRDIRTGSVLSTVTLPSAPLSGPIVLSDDRFAVVFPPPVAQGQSTVSVYDGAERVWSVDVPSFVRWVAPAHDGGAYIQTLDPSYACAD